MRTAIGFYVDSKHSGSGYSTNNFSIIVVSELFCFVFVAILCRIRFSDWKALCSFFFFFFYQTVPDPNCCGCPVSVLFQDSAVWKEHHLAFVYVDFVKARFRVSRNECSGVLLNQKL